MAYIDYYAWEAPILPAPYEANQIHSIALSDMDDTPIQTIWKGTSDPDGYIDLSLMCSQYLTASEIFKGIDLTQPFEYEPKYFVVLDRYGDEMSFYVIDYNWSYNNDYKNNDVQILNIPITPKVIKGQKLFFSLRNYTGNTYDTMIGNEQVSLNRFRNTIYPCDTSDGSLPQDISFLYNISESCDYAVLYYINPIGGIDSIPVRPAYTASHTKKTSTTQFKYQANDPSQTNTNRYMINVQSQYNVTTDPLTDTQSSRMSEVFNSPMMWFDDLKSTPKACYIQDGSISIQTYLNQNKKAPQYNFTIKINDILRR